MFAITHTVGQPNLISSFMLDASINILRIWIWLISTAIEPAKINMTLIHYNLSFCSQWVKHMLLFEWEEQFK